MPFDKDRRTGRCHDDQVEVWERPADERRQRVLQPWSKYPVDQVPRPVVLLNDRVLGGGFASGAAKIAYLSGAFDVAVDIPAAVIESLPRQRSGFDGAPIAITAAILDAADFETDRGRQRLPAWRLTISGMRTDCAVLEPTFHGWWPAGSVGHRLRRAGATHAHLAADDISVQLHVAIVAADDVPAIVFVETKTAVLFERTPPDPALQRTAGLTLWSRRVSATLPSPLGDRVLIDDRGVPLVVERTR